MSDTDLIRYLHDELDADERARLVAHIGTSPAAAERVRVLRHREARLSSLLGTVDPAADDVEASARQIRERMAAQGTRHGERPTHETRVLTHEHWWRRVPPPFRAVAAAAAMIGVVLLVEPARAWVITNVRAVAEIIGLINGPVVTPAPDASATDPDAQLPGASARLTFPWSADVIVIDASNARGTIIVRRGPTGRVTAEVAIAGDGEVANMVVTPAGLRLEGRADVRYTAVIIVPPSVRTLRLDARGTSSTHTLPADGSALRLDS